MPKTHGSRFHKPKSGCSTNQPQNEQDGETTNHLMHVIFDVFTTSVKITCKKYVKRKSNL
jgi:hypothetical protein